MGGGKKFAVESRKDNKTLFFSPLLRGVGGVLREGCEGPPQAGAERAGAQDFVPLPWSAERTANPGASPTRAWSLSKCEGHAHCCILILNKNPLPASFQIYTDK